MAKATTRRVQLTDKIWLMVEAQAKELKTTESKIVNLLLADTFSKQARPLKPGTVIP